MISRPHNDWKSIYDDLAAAQVAAAADPVVRPKPATGDALPIPSPPPTSLPGTNTECAPFPSTVHSAARSVGQIIRPINFSVDHLDDDKLRIETAVVWIQTYIAILPRRTWRTAVCQGNCSTMIASTCSRVMPGLIWRAHPSERLAHVPIDVLLHRDPAREQTIGRNGREQSSRASASAKKQGPRGRPAPGASAARTSSLLSPKLNDISKTANAAPSETKGHKGRSRQPLAVSNGSKLPEGHDQRWPRPEAWPPRRLSTITIAIPLRRQKASGEWSAVKSSSLSSNMWNTMNASAITMTTTGAGLRHETIANHRLDPRILTIRRPLANNTMLPHAKKRVRVGTNDYVEESILHD